MEYGFVKVGAYTPEIKVCDVEYNTNNIIEGILESEKKGVEVLVFPELVLCGYTCADLFYSDTLLEGCLLGIEKILKISENKNIIMFIGSPLKINGQIYNCAVAVSKGKILGVTTKENLPNSNEFYERRQFSVLKSPTKIKLFNQEVLVSNNVIYCDKNNKSLRIAVEICEDLWVADSPSIRHAKNGANIIVNLSSSSEVVGKKEYREKLISVTSAKLCTGYIYADSGEGESTTDLVFAGHNIIAENGSLLSESELFSSGLTVADIDVGFLDYERSKGFENTFDGYDFIEFELTKNPFNLNRTFNKTPFIPDDGDSDRLQTIMRMQAEGLKKRIMHTNSNKVIIGLSGGLDSTLALLVSVLSMELSGRNLKDIIAVTMPCFGTTSRTFNNSVNLAKALGITIKKIDITKSVTRHLKDIKHDFSPDVSYENAQARERTQVLMDIANMNNGLVVGTGDLSEIALGWSTYNGDHMSMYAVNSSVPKTLVRKLVEFSALKNKGKVKSVLLDILDTPVSPELLPVKNDKQSQETESIVGPYVLHDFFLFNMIMRGYSPKKLYQVACKTFEKEFDKETVLKWLKIFIKRFFSQQFKRSCMPDGVKIGSVSLSPRGDYKMPSDAVCSLWLKELEEM